MVQLLLSYTIRYLSFLVPKRKGLWVFVGWHRNDEREVFADNSKYMFLQSQSAVGVRPVWIAHDRQFARLLTEAGFEAYYQNSLRGALYALMAEVTFVDAFFKIVNWRYAGGSQTIQLWHGKGFKKVGEASPEYDKKNGQYKNPHLFTRYDRIIASSEYTSKMMAEIFGVDQSRILVTGLPRNDIFFKHIEGAEIDGNKELAKVLKKKDGYTYILFAPTFRRYEYDPIAAIEFEIVDAYLEKTNSKLIISLHPKFKYSKFSFNKYKHIHFVPAGYDLYPFLMSFDILITDYSSIFIEFALLDKPMVFFVPDIDTYKKTTGLYSDYETLIPGPRANSTSSLLGALDEASQAPWREKRLKVRDLFFTHRDGGSAERIIAALKKNNV